MNTEFRLMPEQASSIADNVDRLYVTLLIGCGIMATVILFLIVYFGIKYRRGSSADRRERPRGNTLTELVWISGPFLFTMLLFVWGAQLYFQQSRPPAGAMELNCVARQWMWKFQHADGTAEINDLHVPLNQAIKINLISEDVIHSLYIPAFRVKHDVLPGRYTSIWFQATKPGQYHLFCAEYCGAKHSTMGGTVHVLDPHQYQQWLSGRTGRESGPRGPVKFLEQLRCTSCHLGGDAAGRGPPLQNLIGNTVRFQNGQSVVADANYIRESILQPTAKVVAGYQPLMPSYDGQVGEDTILQLIAEIKSLGTSDASAAVRENTDAKSIPVPRDRQPMD